MDRVRRRIGDKRVLALVKAFLKAGILAEDGRSARPITGTPQGGILSPLLANVALSVLDEHFAQAWEAPAATPYRAPSTTSPQGSGQLPARPVRGRLRASWSHGTRADAEALREEIAAVLAPMGLRLSAEKTMITHIDEGLDFLGWRIQRHRKRGTNRKLRLHLPVEEGAGAIMDKVKTLPARQRTERSPPCCTGSTRCCGAGAPTSGTACRRRPSATSTSMRGVECSDGSSVDTARRSGPSCSAGSM